MGFDDERSAASYFIAPYRGDTIRGCWVLQRTVSVPARLGDVVQEVPAHFDGRWSPNLCSRSYVWRLRRRLI